MAISALLKSRRVTNRAVCQTTQIHPSYFSRALKGEASLSQIQIFRLSQFFQLEKPETRYFLLLWNYQEAQSRDEKNFFRLAIEETQEKHQRVAGKIKAKIISAEEKKVQIQQYYSEAITASVHICLTIPRFRSQPRLIADYLKISELKLQSELEKLHSLGILQLNKGKVEKLEESIHLPEESATSFQNHINWRLSCIQNINQRDPRPSDYHLSVVFSANQETKQQLKKLLRETVLKVQGQVESCDSTEEIYHLMMDLF